MSFIITDADTGQRLAAARDALSAEEKALEREARGHRVAILPGRPLPPPAPKAAPPDVPPGYRRLDPRPLAPSTRKRDPERWRREALDFPVDWGRWGEGHLTANVAYACLDRGLVQIAVPLKKGKPYLYRRVKHGGA